MLNRNLSISDEYGTILRLGFLLILLLTVSLSAQTKESIAVLDMEGRGISAVEAATLTDRMRSELVSTGAVTVVERGQMQSILSEQDFQLTGCTSDECAVQIGQMLGVTKMYSGSIGKIGATFTVDVRAIDVETGAIENTITRNYRGEIDGLITEIEHMSWELVGLIHPDEILKQLGDGPGLSLDDVRKKKSGGKWGKRLMWGALIIVGGGAGYMALAPADDEPGAIGSPPSFPDVN